MDVALIVKFLKDKIGLNAETIGVPAVEKAVRDCMYESGVVSSDEYLARLESAPYELKRLVESVVVPETYFFRDLEPFLALEKHLMRFWLKRKDSKPLRILSIPCSTGEEPYSIAMLLLDMKLDKNRFVIDAVDISEQAIEVARLGIYSPYSFRRADLAFRERYFTKCGEEFILSKEVRQLVNFRQGNLLSEDFVHDHHTYDVIFCRNLLIYFDDKAREKVMSVLSQLLDKGGILFVGHAETAIFSGGGYFLLDHAKAFILRKTSASHKFESSGVGGGPCTSNRNDKSGAKAESKTASPAAAALAGESATGSTGKKTTCRKEDEWSHLKDDGMEGKKEDEEEKIDEAFRLADTGAIDEAIEICKELVKRNTDSEEVYYLLGQAMDAMGDSYQAEEFLKRAIYLNPDYYDALLYLAVMYERMGNIKDAERFRHRADRALKRGLEEADA